MSNTSLESRKILVVEDELLIATNIEQVLSGAGADVHIANTAKAAHEALSAIHFDAAVLDVHLDDERSYDVADALRERETPFLFLSGFLTIRSGYEHLPFVAKPFSAKQVLSVVEGLFAPEQAQGS